VAMVSLAPKMFVEHGSYNKRNVPAKQNFSDTVSEMARNFLDIVLKNSLNVWKMSEKNKQRSIVLYYAYSRREQTSRLDLHTIILMLNIKQGNYEII